MPPHSCQLTARIKPFISLQHLALKYLNELVDEGYLRALGRKNSRFYAPVPGRF